jgi:DNA-binding transcriptional ArsR family regulator
MELEQRLTELERRIAALEHPGRAPDTRVPEAPDDGGDGDPLRALREFQDELDRMGAEDGGIQFTGSVRLPTHERYEWQYGALTAGLLDIEWADSADSFAALGHPVRLRLLREILGGRHTAAELTALEGLGTTGQIYHHLSRLTSAGWLHTTGRGRHEVPGARVVPLLVALTAARP